MPVPNDKLYTPTIENCENMLRDMCFDKAHELYGDPLPEYIQDRLEKELNGIISNGYSVIYYIAHKIIKKANEDGYIVGFLAFGGNAIGLIFGAIPGLSVSMALAQYLQDPSA